MSFLRRALRRILGADVIHAYRNRREIANSDIVWTHTEFESLAVLAILRFCANAGTPKVIAQSVHLFDLWSELPLWKRYVYKRLLERADALTVLSNANLAICKSLFLLKDCRLVKFGISLDDFPITPPHFQPSSRAIKIASLGNDMHRDWDVLLEAFGNRENVEVKLAVPERARQSVAGRFDGDSNFSLIHPRNLREIHSLYSWADVVIVPLKENFHASGITVILEAIAQGKPVIAANTGGLDTYFCNGEIFYYHSGDANSLIQTFRDCIADPCRAEASVFDAQNRILQDELTSAGYAKRHIELSRDLLRSSRD